MFSMFNMNLPLLNQFKENKKKNPSPSSNCLYSIRIYLWKTTQAYFLTKTNHGYHVRYLFKTLLFRVCNAVFYFIY